jgi:DNA sulfur modification protein DndD
LVLLLSSAAWGEGVAKALDPYVGKRYVLLSRQEGPRGNKPVKTMMLGKRTITLNEYDADRDESVIMEL